MNKDCRVYPGHSVWGEAARPFALVEDVPFTVDRDEGGGRAQRLPGLAGCSATWSTHFLPDSVGRVSAGRERRRLLPRPRPTLGLEWAGTGRAALEPGHCQFEADGSRREQAMERSVQ